MKIFHLVCFILLNWSVLDSYRSFDGKACGPPGRPSKATVTFNTTKVFSPGDKVVFTCYPGFILEGASKRVCGERGLWLGSLPTCSKLTLVLNIPCL